MTEKNRYEEDFGENIWAYRNDNLDVDLEEEIKDKVKKRNKKTNIVWKISGDIKEVDEFCQHVFGSGYSLIYYYCQDRVVLNRQYDYQEIIDFRPIFDWEYKGNVDYSLKMTGKVNEKNSIVLGIADSTEKISGKKLSCLYVRVFATITFWQTKTIPF